MSSRPEEEDPVDEIEEGEIVTDGEDEEDFEIEEDEGDFFEEDEDEGMDLAGLMSSLLATPDGDTVCSALVNLCYQLETQNKILIKMLTKMQSQK
jgi:hypothetical protein